MSWSNVKQIPVQRLAWITSLAMIGLIAFAATDRIAAFRSTKSHLTVSPYIVEIWSYAFEGNTMAGQPFAKTVYARSHEGVLVLTQSTAKVGLEKYSRRIEYPDGRYVRIVDFMRMKSTARRDTEHVAKRNSEMMSKPPANCSSGRSSEQVSGPEQINGVTTFAVRSISSGPSGDSLRATTWFAPSLGCAMVQYQHERKMADGSFQMLTKGLNVRALGVEPSDSVLSGYSSYIEAPPSSIYKAYLDSVGKDPKDCPECSAGWAKQDEEYNSSRERSAN